MSDSNKAEKVYRRFQQKMAAHFEGPVKREIPKDFPYDPRALKPMAKALFAASVALGHTLAAHRHFSRIKSPAVSPDGRIGGKGYIMEMQEIRKKLWEASEALSSVSDALHDEINAPHWKPRLAQLDENDAEDVSRFVEEAKEVMDEPGAKAEKEIEEIDAENDGVSKKASSMFRSKLRNRTSILEFERELARLEDIQIDPGEGIAIKFSGVESSMDSWAESVLPTDPDTPTEGKDFGLGYGAKGQGSESVGEGSPHSGLPGVPWQSVGDTSSYLDKALNERHSNSVLPSDVAEPVARSDYYRGDKGNLVNGESAPEEVDLGLTDTGYVYEDLDTTRLPKGEPGLGYNNW